jgi:hypothetical protein
MKPVDRATRSIWRSLNWRDPRTDLVELGKIQGRFVKKGHQPEVDHLRNHELRQYLEQRQAALFAHFVSEAILKAPIAYAMKETEDYDCVLWWKIEKHRPIGWADEGSPSFAIDGLRTSAHPIVLPR